MQKKFSLAHWLAPVLIYLGAVAAVAKTPAFFVIGDGPKIYIVEWRQNELQLVPFDLDRIDDVDFATYRRGDFNSRAADFNQKRLKIGAMGLGFHDLVSINGGKPDDLHLITKAKADGKLSAYFAHTKKEGYLRANPNLATPKFGDLIRYVRGPSRFPGMIVMDRHYQLGFQVVNNRRIYFGEINRVDDNPVVRSYLSGGTTVGRNEERVVLNYSVMEYASGVLAHTLARLTPSTKLHTGNTYSEALAAPEDFVGRVGFPMFHSSDPNAKLILETYAAAARGRCDSLIVVSADLLSVETIE